MKPLRSQTFLTNIIKRSTTIIFLLLQTTSKISWPLIQIKREVTHRKSTINANNNVTSRLRRILPLIQLLWKMEVSMILKWWSSLTI